MSELKAALVDLDGTVYLGTELLSGAHYGLEGLETAGIETVFLSNNATKRPTDYREKLAGLGIDVTLDEILNSSAVAADYLATHHPDAGVFVLGEPPLRTHLEEADLTVTSDPEAIDIVLASMDRAFDYEKLQIVLDADRQSEVLLYATNPDQTCPVEDGEIPDCGAVIGALEGLLGREIDQVLGKPSPVTVDIALERLGVAPEECVMIGDRLETDIRMGELAGMRTALVCTGVTDPDDLAGTDVEPDYVLDSLADVTEVIE